MKNKICFTIIISLLITFCMPSISLAADSLSLADKLVASDGAADDNFGFSVATSGDLAVIGSYDNTDSGAVYINNLYTGNVKKLTASDGAFGDKFGYSVAISGDLIVVGALSDDDNGNNSGSIYIYDLSDGYRETKITASDGAEYDNFGESVAISGDLIVVGSSSDDDNGYNSGSVYVYDISDGYRETKITASDGATHDNFGYSVSISGDLAIVGAYNDNDNGDESGSVYIYDLSDGNKETKLTASDGAPYDFFGCSVSVSGNYVAVGAKGDDDNGSYSGSVYVYDLSDGSRETKITASDSAAYDMFGYSVSILGDKVLVGAPNDNEVAANSGAAYIYDLSNGNLETKLTASDGAPGDWFGIAVAISEGNVVIGSYCDDDKGWDSGSAYYIYAPEFNIALNNLGGSGETSLVAAYSKPMPSDVTAPTRDDYIFMGYYRNLYEEDTKYYNADMTSGKNWDILGDTTLYAKWEAEPIAIDTTSLSEATVGESYSFTVESYGGVGAHIWYATGLPNGLSIASNTGIISGKTNDSGDFAVNIKAYDSLGKSTDKDFTLTVNAQSLTGKYTIAPFTDSIYTVSTVDDFTILTINSGVSGFKYIKTNVTPSISHENEETVIFTHLRGGVQIGFNCTIADFDIINSACAGFNVQAGDIIKIYVVDQISNDPGVVPVILH